MIELFERAVPFSQLHRSIYSCPGVGRFLNQLLHFPSLQKPEQLWGIRGNGQALIAAAHTRTFKSGTHLNILAVDPDIQGKELGSRMLDYWEERAKDSGLTQLTLDVADDNASAQRFYIRRGFREYSRSYEFRLRDGTYNGEWKGITLSNWPQAVANLQAYGFGKFQLEWKDLEFGVDLRPDYFRVYHPETALVAALRKMDATRAIYLRHSDPIQYHHWHPTGAIIRMIKEIL